MSLKNTDSSLADSGLLESFLLGGRVRLYRPSYMDSSFCDAIFLMSAVTPAPGDVILDMGCGPGAASLCLATRFEHIRTIALDTDRQWTRLTAENAELNHLKDRIEVLNAQFDKLPPRLEPGTYAHVVVHAHALEQDIQESNIARAFDMWANFALLMVKPMGSITFLHPAKRLGDVLHYFYGRLGHIVSFPLWHDKTQECETMLVQGIKGAPNHFHLLPGMCVLDEEGKFTKEAEAVLRLGQGLRMRS